MKKHRVGIVIGVTRTGNGAEKTEQALENVEDQARDLRRELDKIDGLDPKVRAQIEGVANSMDRAAVSGRKMAAAKSQAGQSSRKSGLAVLEFSRAVEDAQYGIRGVLNNIPQLVMLLGGGGGLAGVISLAAVGLTQLVSHFNETEEAAKEAGKWLEVTRNQIEAFYEEAARDGTAGYRRSMAAVVEILGQQNTALERNLKLTRAKRQAELRVASAGQDLEIAEIARQELSGEITSEQAEAQRRAIDAERIRTAALEKITIAEEEAEQVRKRQVDVAERLMRSEEELIERNAERSKAQEKLNQLQSVAASLEDSAVAFAKESGDDFSEETVRRNAVPEKFRLEIIELEKVVIPALNETISALKTNVSSLNRQSVELLDAQVVAETAVRQAQETETQIADLKVQTIEVKARTEAQKEAVREGNELLREIISDGIITVEEQRRVAEFQRDFQRRFGEVTTEQMVIMRDLAMQAQITQTELAQIKEQIRRLSANRGR